MHSRRISPGGTRPAGSSGSSGSSGVSGVSGAGTYSAPSPTLTSNPASNPAAYPAANDAPTNAPTDARPPLLDASLARRRQPPPTRRHSFAPSLRQMVAVLEAERQALAAMDLDKLTMATAKKQDLCGYLEAAMPSEIDEETRGLLESARRLNEVNRKVRNLIAANIATRLDNLTGSPSLYSRNTKGSHTSR